MLENNSKLSKKSLLGWSFVIFLTSLAISYAAKVCCIYSGLPMAFGLLVSLFFSLGVAFLVSSKIKRESRGGL